MSNKVEGFIGKIFTKTGGSGKRAWALDNFLIQDPDGEDIGWFGNGFRDDVDVAPKCKEGDYIVFEWEQEGKYQNIVKGTAAIRAPEKAPERTQKQAPAASGGDQSTQQNIHYQNSRTAAIELVGLLLDSDALPVTGAKTKAGQAKRFDEISAAVDQITVRFFNDLESFRLFDTVADTGEVDTSPDGDLPEDSGNDAPSAPAADDGDEPL